MEQPAIKLLTDEFKVTSVSSQTNSLNPVDPNIAAEFASMVQTTKPEAIAANYTAIQPSALPHGPAGVNLPAIQNSQEKPLFPTPLLGLVNDLSRDYQQRMSTIHDTAAQITAEDGSFNASKALEVQVKIMETMLIVGETAKAAGSLASTVTQLTKMQ